MVAYSINDSIGIYSFVRFFECSSEVKQLSWTEVALFSDGASVLAFRGR